jgi:hypothetical protein
MITQMMAHLGAKLAVHAAMRKQMLSNLFSFILVQVVLLIVLCFTT